MSRRLPKLLATCMTLAGLLSTLPSGFAQLNILNDQPLIGGQDQQDDDPLTVSAEFTAPQGGQPGELRVTAKLAPNWHIYSTTQKQGGPNRSKLKLTPSDRYRLAGDFKPQPAPQIEHNWPGAPSLAVEEHHGEVTWRAPFELTADADSATLEIRGALNAQACAESCLPPKDYPFVARIADGSPTPSPGPSIGDRSAVSAGSYQGSHVALEGRLEPAPDGDGGQARLVITARPAAGWHIYSLADQAPDLGSQPTIIRFSAPPGLSIARRSASVQPTVEAVRDPSLKPVSYHSEPVTWTMLLDLPTTDATSLAVGGAIGFQTCADAGQCDLPEGARFQTELTLADGQPTPLHFSQAKYSDVKRLAAGAVAAPTAPTAAAARESNRASRVPAAAPPANRSLAWILGAALFGGLVLNFMPCVLPVIGLKILSFVEQAGKQRSQILLLNIYYSVGMLLVFLSLATLAVVFSLGWGEQFSSTGFNIAMAGLVFAMALSFLGVWEIPIPGFVGAGKAQSLAEGEGALGAISKGVITTLLATPCSGPLLGTVFGYTLEQPPAITYLIFLFVGLGMAAPYLAIGAFPSLIRFLPRPGAWMNTFKHLMGFAMLGGVVIVLSFIRSDFVVAAVGMLMALWAGCWWINRTPAYAGFPRLLAAWTQGIAIAACAGGLSFALFLPSESLIAWKPYTPQTLAQLSKEGKTVLVDFTAEWCLTCKTNLKFAINTQDVARAIERNGVVPLLADWTDGSEEIHAALRSLGSNSIPVLAVFPAARPDQPIILRDLLFKSDVVQALEQAGPSVGREGPSITATAADR